MVKKENTADNLKAKENINYTPKSKGGLEEDFLDKKYISEGIRNPEPIGAGNNSQSDTASGGGNNKDGRGGDTGTGNIAN